MNETQLLDRFIPLSIREKEEGKKTVGLQSAPDIGRARADDEVARRSIIPARSTQWPPLPRRGQPSASAKRQAEPHLQKGRREERKWPLATALPVPGAHRQGYQPMDRRRLRSLCHRLTDNVVIKRVAIRLVKPLCGGD